MPLLRIAGSSFQRCDDHTWQTLWSHLTRNVVQTVQEDNGEVGTMLNTHFQKNPVVEAAPLQEETLLFHPQRNAFCVLNSTASFIWTCLATPNRAEQLVEKLGQSFQGVSPVDALREDVQSVLQHMQELELIVVVSQPEEEV